MPAPAAIAATMVAAIAIAGPLDAPRAAAADDPTKAPVTRLASDGRTVTDGHRSLRVSQAAGLVPGQQVTVAGAGYDTTKGIYVALCAIPPANALPTPCGGGVDTAGQAGAAQWISSNPPAYGTGLARPYGPGGTFTATFQVVPTLASGIDCRSARCALVTRSDHTRTADRSQDLLVPVTFATAPAAPAAPPGEPDPPAVHVPPGAVGGGPTATMPPAAPTTTTAALPPPPPTIAPTTTAGPPATKLGDDGRSVSDGTRTLTASKVDDLDPAGEQVTVTGTAFDTSQGVVVALCATPAEAPPGPCAGGDPEVTRWISSTSNVGGSLSVPFEPDGGFRVDVRLAAEIDASTDCRSQPCALVARSDDLANPDRALELALPVDFGKESPATAKPDEHGRGDAEARGGSVVSEPVAAVADEPMATNGRLVSVGGAAAIIATTALVTALARRRQAATS